jgi:hypothetical protein
MFFFGIILILNGIHEDKIKEAEKNVKIQYRFVPRSYYDEQVFSSQFESKFSTLFDEDQDEWSANQRVFTPYNINDFGSAVIGSSCKKKEDDGDDPRERELMPDYSRTARLCYPGSGYAGSGPNCDNYDNENIINLIMKEIISQGIYEEDEVDLSQSGIGYVLAKVDTILLFINRDNYTDINNITQLIDYEFEELKEELQHKNNCIDENNDLNDRSVGTGIRSVNYRTIQKTIDNINNIVNIVNEVIQSNINLGSLSVGTSGSLSVGTSGSLSVGTSGSLSVGTSGSLSVGTSGFDTESDDESDDESDTESDDGGGNDFRFSANANLDLDFDADASLDIRA